MILFLAMNRGKGAFLFWYCKRENGKGGLRSMLVSRYLFFTTGKESF